MRHFALTALGQDRPGIVASIAAVLVRHRVNVEDSQMTILRGHFTMMLVLAATRAVDVPALRAELETAGEQLRLEAVALAEITQIEGVSEPVASHIVSVYGADHLGILHAVSAAMAERAIDITDLNTRLAGDPGRPIYALMMEIALPSAVELDELRLALEDVGAAEGVDVSVRALESDAL